MTAADQLHLSTRGTGRRDPGLCPEWRTDLGRSSVTIGTRIQGSVRRVAGAWEDPRSHLFQRARRRPWPPCVKRRVAKLGISLCMPRAVRPVPIRTLPLRRQAASAGSGAASKVCSYSASARHPESSNFVSSCQAWHGRVLAALWPPPAMPATAHLSSSRAHAPTTLAASENGTVAAPAACPAGPTMGAECRRTAAAPAAEIQEARCDAG